MEYFHIVEYRKKYIPTEYVIQVKDNYFTDLLIRYSHTDDWEKNYFGSEGLWSAEQHRLKQLPDYSYEINPLSVGSLYNMIGEAFVSLL